MKIIGKNREKSCRGKLTIKDRILSLPAWNGHDFRPENQQECVHPDSIHWRLSKRPDIPTACYSLLSNLDCVDLSFLSSDFNLVSIECIDFINFFFFFQKSNEKSRNFNCTFLKTLPIRKINLVSRYFLPTNCPLSRYITFNGAFV